MSIGRGLLYALTAANLAAGFLYGALAGDPIILAVSSVGAALALVTVGVSER